METPPLFTEGWDALAAIELWGTNKSPTAIEQRRHWTVTQFLKKNVNCTLTWVFDAQGSTQIAGVDQCPGGGAEAICLALAKFEEWEAAFAKSKEAAKKYLSRTTQE